MSPQQRLDEALLERALVEDLDRAKRLVMAGRVQVDGTTAVKPSQLVTGGVSIEIQEAPRYVSRGGEKLAAALDRYDMEVSGIVCADVGASTGGFTDCLLQRGAKRVYAIDAGRGQLHWRLRGDDRVVVKERTNARHLEALPEPIALVTLDVSFISLEPLIPVVAGWLAAGGNMVALIKPQFEAEPPEVEAGGVVRSSQVRRRVVRRVCRWATAAGLAPRGLLPSPLLGPKGNQEYLLWAEEGGEAVADEDLLAGLSGGHER